MDSAYFPYMDEQTDTLTAFICPTARNLNMSTEILGHDYCSSGEGTGARVFNPYMIVEVSAILLSSFYDFRSSLATACRCLDYDLRDT